MPKFHQCCLILTPCLLLFVGCGQKTKSVESPVSSQLEANVETITKVSIQSFDFYDCSSVAKSDDGCSCSFRLEKDNWKSVGLVSTLADKSVGCIKLDGSIIEVTGGRTDNRAELYEQSLSEIWITLNQKGPDLFFGKPVDLGKYEVCKEILIQTLLVMDEMPKEIPIKNNNQGMAIREVRDLANDALTEAKDRKAKGDRGMNLRMEYTNEKYDVFITGKVDGHNDSGGDTYEATLEVKRKDGAVLDTKTIWGDCNC